MKSLLSLFSCGLAVLAAASASDAIVDPVGPASGSNRVQKGAGYNFGGERRLASRGSNNLTSTSDNWGFRLAMPARW